MVPGTTVARYPSIMDTIQGAPGKSRASRIGRHIINLANTNMTISRRAERCLLRFYTEEAVEALIAYCASPNPVARYRAAHVLGKSRDSRAFAALLALMNDEDERVRYDAIIALGDLGDPRAAEAVAVWLEPDPQSLEAGAASIALGFLGEAAIPVAQRLLSGPIRGNRRTAVYILASIGGKGLKIVRGLLTSPDPDLRAAAADAIGES